ncbi:L-aspartate oxidase [Robertmurraya korlensis]|uniref:L-aspartate oxidase n=1 Tax=Robertmurraya korlensis TaxID=519977 RepID=UPI0020424AB6|nr:L-aspartate oxidase [Robertmurraya korlensis]MCM3599437.1 L-aspartate oxidase [Robertmurraya korlensis]
MIHSDVLIIGSGVAALQLAKKLSCDINVIVLTKSKAADGNSNLAQGGIAAAIAMEDHPDKHYLDTLEAGRYTNDRELVKEMTAMAPDLIKEMVCEGCAFDRAKDGGLLLGLEGAHSHNRIVHSGGDATGKNIMSFLLKETMHLKIIEEMVVYELLVIDGKCIGVKAKNKHGETNVFLANHVVLATGGLGQLYSFTSNAETVVGDGIALAYLAGAEVADLEFIQFHPTLLFVEGKCQGLVSEAVRGEGAFLTLKDGTRIMKNVHPMEDLAPRHIVSQTIFNYWQAGEQVFLDIRNIKEFTIKFPTITKMCEENQVNLSKGLIPVVPGCHFLMGGVKTDHYGRTSVQNLYAIGEVAYTGIHGANRLASNSLLEGLFFGKRLAGLINQTVKLDSSLSSFSERSSRMMDAVSLPDKTVIQANMMKHAGIVRNKEDLQEHLAWLESFQIQELLSYSIDERSKEDIQVIFMLITAWLVTKSALLREESRGGHFREDFPFEEKGWLEKKIILKHRQEQGDSYEQIKAAFAT